MAGVTTTLGDLNRRITIERPTADDSLMGAGSEVWDPIGPAVWAEILDVRPSRDERLASGINLTTRQAIVTMRYRADITPDMRIKSGDRVMQIVGGPAEIGNRQWLELRCEDYR